MVPAPMLHFLPIVASPKYARCMDFVPVPSVDFLISTKFPTLTPSSSFVFIRRWANGPTEISSPNVVSTTTQPSTTLHLAPIRDFPIPLKQPTVTSPPLTLFPSLPTQPP